MDTKEKIKRLNCEIKSAEEWYGLIVTGIVFLTLILAVLLCTIFDNLYPAIGVVGFSLFVLIIKFGCLHFSVKKKNLELIKLECQELSEEQKNN